MEVGGRSTGFVSDGEQRMWLPSGKIGVCEVKMTEASAQQMVDDVR